ncbi:MAG: hypothetical protein MJ238_04280 [Bacilli bacterium]|nr:hypothetical protein [Bacilli bacterium]
MTEEQRIDRVIGVVLNHYRFDYQALANKLHCDDGSIYRWQSGTQPSGYKLLRLITLYEDITGERVTDIR